MTLDEGLKAMYTLFMSCQNHLKNPGKPLPDPLPSANWEDIETFFHELPDFAAFVIDATIGGYRNICDFKEIDLVDIKAVEDDGTKGASTQDIVCDVFIKVLEVKSSSYLMQMDLKNAAIVSHLGKESERGQKDKNTEQYISRPLLFEQSKSGTIYNVHAHASDYEDAIEMKTGILNQFRSSAPAKLDAFGAEFTTEEVIDNQGYHYEYVETERRDDMLIVRSQYCEDDFIGFVDSKATADQIDLDVVNEQQIQSGMIVNSHSEMTVVLNKGESISNGEGESTDIVSTGQANMRFLSKSTSNDDGEDYEDLDDFINKINEDYRPISYMTKEWYESREKESEFASIEEDEGIFGASSTCPSALTLCKGFDKSWTVGNRNVGLKLSARALAGVTKECKIESRSYMVGAYASIDILILKKTVSAVNAIAEYGLLDGSPSRNMVELKLFNKVIYQKKFPWKECVYDSVTLCQYTRDFSVGFSIHILVVKIKFLIGIELGFKTELKYKMCLQQLTASITFVPSASASLHGGAEASVIVVKAGIELRGTISDNLDPTAYIDGNQCRVGFSMYNTFSPIEASLQGYYCFRKLKFKHWKLKFTWGKKHALKIWSHKWGGSRTKIIDM
ncbi:putative lipid transport family protein [Monocercomonoides exilis]|uniref:putative lipid transport family protein n=1 Tax=Monocercomonoides exilis TaxID=2049356 RepID=UPI0035595BB8|nr:putative lipid transport family protein [Monocercomonoides exilis]|eukprot:MONOS_1823.1-p1 / transcript=MONOS_1823.1 / gene=MONOS_1823 / organism=Monocercomonoides_exilis_PA203 / gene_product=lipid transport family protein / transcript_product=lipid transport family protein / location=Mono_scaffold00034:116354-118718(-) / protein_length=618 / sequence_SO=supercontig / SO=protein_coding / is_pseudo=false